MTEEDEGLVERLRRTVCHGSLRCERLGVDDQAADRIEAQAAEIERLLNLLRDCNTESISWLDARDAALEVRTGYNIGDDAPWHDEAIAAWNTRQPTQSDALKAAGDAIRGLLDIASDDNLDSEQAGRAYAALHDIGTALKGQSK